MDIDSVYRLYFRDVFLFLQGLTHNEALAEELTQETFFKALDGLKDYDDRQDVRAWLFTVARNAYYSHCRRTKHTAPLEDAETAPADTPDIAQLLVDRDAAFTVHQCLHTLDEPYKEVFSLRVFGELPFERIGLIFGHNAAWARVTYYRAKTQLQKMLYGDNVFEKDGIRRDRTGDGEKTRCLCGKRGIFNRDGPAMGPQIIRQLERRASRRSASFFHALASPGRPRNGGGASGAYQPAEGRKALIQGRFRAQEGPLGPSRKSQQQTKRTGFAALEDSIADEAPEGKRAKRANRALNRAGINSRGQKQGFGGADRRGGRVTSR